MQHIRGISQTAPAAAATSLEIKLNATIEIVDRLLLAQRQAAWKTPFPTGGAEGTSTDTGVTPDIPTYF